MRKRKANQISSPTAIGIAEARRLRTEKPEMSTANRNSALIEAETVKIIFAVFAAYRRLYFPAVKISLPFYMIFYHIVAEFAICAAIFIRLHIILKRNKKQKALTVKAFSLLPR